MRRKGLSFIFQVSWVRKSDAHILTVDQFSYINDDRFFVILPDTAAAPSSGEVLEETDSADASGRGRPPRRRLLPADAEAWTLHLRSLDCFPLI